MATKWDSLVKEEHVPLCQYMSMFALKAVLLALFGSFMKDDKEVLNFHREYEIVRIEFSAQNKCRGRLRRGLKVSVKLPFYSKFHFS